MVGSQQVGDQVRNEDPNQAELPDPTHQASVDTPRDALLDSWWKRTFSRTLDPLRWLRRGILHSVSTLEILLGGFGLLAALVTALLLASVLDNLPGLAGDVAPVGVAILLAPIGIGVALSRRAEVERAIDSLRGRAPAGRAALGFSSAPQPDEALLDTSAIIDGRIADIVESGFLLADLVVPRFVLDELRRVADGSDPLKRRRGRAGLELLTRLQASEHVETIIIDDTGDDPDADGGEPDVDVDARLVRVARARGAALVLTDSNLARVAEIEGVRTLNLHKLANAIKTVALPGEQLNIFLAEPGRETGQAVGYLPDGTMVVVEHAADQLGASRDVVVKRVIQTHAGRMIFAALSGEQTL